MKKGFKLIVPSLLAILVCVLLLAGSTFALFTSDVTKNIVVGSATVNMTAEYTEFKAYSVEADDNGTAGEATAYGVTSKYKYSTEDVETVVANSSYIFANKGTAKLTDENTIELVNVTPGDRITANLKVTNNSNVDIIYRVRLNAISDNGLLDGLTVKAGGETLTGVIKVGEWTPWNVPTELTKVENIALEVFLPVEAGNEYQTKQATLRFTIEAVQANAKTDTLLDQVNAYLAGTSSPSKNNTMYDAIQEVKGNTEFAAFDATKYLWSPDTDQFYAPYTVVAGFESHFFKAYLQAEFNELIEQKYNIYAIGEWTGSINITVGFDAGEATGITSINYDRHDATTAQKVVIRTNSVETSLTINGYVNPSDSSKGDVIRHYGAAGSVDIISVANASYHEYGKVAFMEIAKGRAALESGSQVTQIHISTQVTAVADDGTKTKTANTFDSITIALASDIEAPEFSRDAVSEIAEGGTLVVALQEGTVDANASKDYVWLYQQGVIQQMVVTTTSTFDANSKATDYDESSNTYQVADDIANNFTGSNTWENVAKDENGNITDVDVTSDSGLTETVKEFEKEQAVYSAFVEEKIAEYEGPYWIDAHENSFAGGSGTELDPYLVSTPMQLALIAYNVNNNIDNGSYAGAYYKLTANIDLSSKYWTGIGTWQHPFHGSIDGDAGNGNVYEIKNMHDGGIATQGAMFRNYTTRTVGGPYGLISVAGSKTADCDLSVTNLKITGISIDLAEGNAVGAVIGFAPRTKDFGIIFTDPKGENGDYWISDDWKQGLIGSSHNNDYKYAFYFAEENRWYKETTYKIGDTYYQGMAGAVGVGNKAIRNIIIENVYTEGTISALDLASGIIGKAYNSGSFTVNNCEIHCDITATGGRAAGIAGYASVPSSVVITNSVIVGKISATSTGVAPDYLTGSRDNNPINETNIVASGDSSKFTCTGNSFSGEIWWQGNKQE